MEIRLTVGMWLAIPALRCMAISPAGGQGDDFEA
jgi:hypothetical protein